MAGLQDDPDTPKTGWQVVGESNHDADDDSCEWCRTKTFRRLLYSVENANYHRQIKVGSSCKDKITKSDTNSSSNEDDLNNGTGEKSGNDSSNGDRPPTEKPVPIPELILLAGVSMVLLGNLGLFEDFYSRLIPNESPLPAESQVPSESPGNANNRYRNKISPEAEEKLRECLKENIKSLVGVPGLSDLVESLTNENESSITETQRQVRLLYNKIQQLRKTITDCDPSLIKELIEADKREEQENKQEQEQFRCQDSVTIIGGLVNIRLLPSSNSEVIAQALYGTCLQIDNQAFNYPSEEQRQAIDPCECWYPVILPNGMRGYVHHHYASRVPSSP
jgi:hypothetical protein